MMAYDTLEKALLRESQTLDAKTVLKPTVITNISDIRSILSEFDPKNSVQSPEIELSTILNEVENGKTSTYAVKAVTRSKTKREFLLEGMDMIKRQMSAAEKLADAQSPIMVNNVLMKPTKFGKVGGETWVDQIIHQWFGGYRDGLHICWDIGEHQYRYDIYEHKLSRITYEK